MIMEEGSCGIPFKTMARKLIRPYQIVENLILNLYVQINLLEW